MLATDATSVRLRRTALLHLHSRIATALCLLLSSIPASGPASACSCIPDEPPFIEAALSAPVVAVVEGIRLHGHWSKNVPRFVDVRVLRYLKGALDPGVLVIEGDNGAECRHYAARFKPGRTWVVALYPAPSSRPSRPLYSADRCSVSMLPLVDGQVTGPLSRPNPEAVAPTESIPLDTLVERLVEASAKS